MNVTVRKKLTEEKDRDRDRDRDRYTLTDKQKKNESDRKKTYIFSRAVLSNFNTQHSKKA